MKDVEELLKKIVKKSKDKNAIYLYGVEYSSNTAPGFKAMVRFSKDNVPSFAVAAKTKRQLKKEIQAYIDGDDVKNVNIRYHLAQIDLEEQAIRFHKNAIKDLEEYEGLHS